MTLRDQSEPDDIEIPEWVEPGEEDLYREFAAKVAAKRDEMFRRIVEANSDPT